MYPLREGTLASERESAKWARNHRRAAAAARREMQQQQTLMAVVNVPPPTKSGTLALFERTPVLCRCGGVDDKC